MSRARKLIRAGPAALRTGPRTGPGIQSPAKADEEERATILAVPRQAAHEPPGPAGRGTAKDGGRGGACAPPRRTLERAHQPRRRISCWMLRSARAEGARIAPPPRPTGCGGEAAARVASVVCGRGLVGASGFEPPTTCTPTARSEGASVQGLAGRKKQISKASRIARVRSPSVQSTSPAGRLAKPLPQSQSMPGGQQTILPLAQWSFL
jgi:hypothetical protein